MSCLSGVCRSPPCRERARGSAAGHRDVTMAASQSNRPACHQAGTTEQLKLSCGYRCQTLTTYSTPASAVQVQLVTEGTQLPASARRLPPPTGLAAARPRPALVPNAIEQQERQKVWFHQRLGAGARLGAGSRRANSVHRSNTLSDRVGDCTLRQYNHNTKDDRAHRREAGARGRAAWRWAPKGGPTLATRRPTVISA